MCKNNVKFNREQYCFFYLKYIIYYINGEIHVF